MQALRADWPLGPGVPPEQEPEEVGRGDEVCQEDDDQAGKIECEDFLSLCATIEDVTVIRMAQEKTLSEIGFNIEDFRPARKQQIEGYKAEVTAMREEDSQFDALVSMVEGYGILDTGCARNVMGVSLFNEM